MVSTAEQYAAPHCATGGHLAGDSTHYQIIGAFARHGVTAGMAWKF